jgi:NADH-quinone oxidoreductase subunit H
MISGYFWIDLILKVVLVLVAMILMALVAIYGELKVMAHMQNRIGPYYAGGRWGWAQPLADAAKFIQKEDLVPAGADAPIFKTAPYIVVAATVATFVVIPFSPSLIARDLDLGVFFLLAISSLTTLGVLMAGWSSANKYSLMGGLRAGAQLIAYELPLVLTVVAVVVQAGTMSLVGIVEAQAAPVEIGGLSISLPFLLKGQIVGFVIFLVAAIAELSRIPFDMPIAESELTMGYLTEYSSLRFTMFFLGEYAAMISMSAVAATLFLGGYWLPFVPESALTYLGPLILIAKIAVLVFLMLWLRSTWPRLREDQLQDMAWRWLIPISLANILVVAFFKVVVF